MGISRRQLMAGAAAGTVSGVLGPAAAQAAPLPDDADRLLLADRAAHARYRTLVPELFRPPPPLAPHTPVIVVGSGFGASVAALRLAQAGQQVAILERGSRWPRSAWRDIHSDEMIPDGRAFWHRRRFTGLSGLTTVTSNFGGVFDATDYDGIQVWRGAAVGGGSIVFTGVLLEPPKQYFEQIFGAHVSWRDMHEKWYPMARRMLKASAMPDDVYLSSPFGHSRRWDAHARRAGYEPQPLDGIWDWQIVRQELSGQSRPSAIVGESNFGNANAAKFDLTRNYLPQAEATGRATIHHWHSVERIGRTADGRYTVSVHVVDPTGASVRRETVTCDRLVLGAGSVGSSELLVRAKAEGTLPGLNDEIGRGWGSNGDGGLVQFIAPSRGLTQASPSASTILDTVNGLPTRMESWYPLGTQLNIGALCSLGMVMDSTRGHFRYDSVKDDVVLSWPGQKAVEEALRQMQKQIADANGVGTGVPIAGVKDVNADFTAHPLGGACLGEATDSFGRVHGYEGLYVMDGSAIPGSTGTANPSLTITALAERNIAQVIADGQ